MSFVKNMRSINWDDQDIGSEEISAVIKSLSQGVGAKGENLDSLEEEFKQRLGCKHAILASNCTTALMTSLLALKEIHPEIKKIAVPSFTFIASANASKFVLDDVELVDCDLNDWNIRVEDVPNDSKGHLFHARPGKRSFSPRLHNWSGSRQSGFLYTAPSLF